MALLCFLCTWLASRFSLKSQRMTYSICLKLVLLFKGESSGREWNKMLPDSSLILSANTQTPVNTPSGQLAGSKWSAILSLMDDTCGLTLYSLLEEILCSEMWHLSDPAAAAAAKSLQLCLTLCDPIDGSPPGSPIPGILQARTLEWTDISFSNAWKWKVKVKSLSCVWLTATPWTAAFQAPPSMWFSRQDYWNGLPFPSPGDLSDPGIQPGSPALKADSLLPVPPGKPVL